MAHHDRALSRSARTFCYLLATVGAVGWGWLIHDTTSQAMNCFGALTFVLEHTLNHPPPPRLPAPPPPPKPVEPVQPDSHCDTPPPRQIFLPRGVVPAMLAEQRALATSSRFVPSVRDGKPNGFKVYAVRPHSIFGAVGLCNGDTVVSVGGISLTAPDDALAAYAALSRRFVDHSMDHVDYEIERRGQRWSVRVRIPDDYRL